MATKIDTDRIAGQYQALGEASDANRDLISNPEARRKGVRKVQITVTVDPEDYEQFRRLCSRDHVSMSSRIQGYISTVVTDPENIRWLEGYDALRRPPMRGRKKSTRRISVHKSDDENVWPRSAL